MPDKVWVVTCVGLLNPYVVAIKSTQYLAEKCVQEEATLRNYPLLWFDIRPYDLEYS